MSDLEPTVRGEGSPAGEPGTTGGPTPAASAATAAGQSSTPPAGGAGVRWAAMSRNEQLALAGAGVMLGSYLLGILLSGWSLGLPQILLVLGAAVAAAVVLAGSTLSGAARAAAFRVSAGIAAVFAAIDIGDLISEYSDWGTIDILLTITAAIGAGILLVAAWRLTGGDVVRDATGLLSASDRTLPDRLVLLGGSAIVVGWFVLRAADASFSETSALAVLAAVLAVAVIWMAGGGAGAMQWPVQANLVNIALGAVVAVLALSWLVNVLDDIGRASVFDLAGLVLFIGGAATLAAGVVLAIQAGRLARPA